MNSSTIAKKLIELRCDKTIEEVAKAVEISERALMSYEYAERIPRDEVKMRLAEYYNTTVQAIFFNP